MFAQPKSFFISLINSSKPGPINTLITNFPLGFNMSVNSRWICSKSQKSLIASMSFSPMVLGAMSDWMMSTLLIWFSSKIFWISCFLVTSWMYVLMFVHWTSVSLMSNQTILKFWIFNFCNCATAYWIQLPGEHPISSITLVSLPKIWNFSWISSSLNALLALYPSSLAFLK